MGVSPMQYLTQWRMVMAANLLRRSSAQLTHIAQDVGYQADTAFIRDNFPARYALKDQDGILSPDAIAENYWQLHCQPRSAWTHELDLRPWLEAW